MPDLELAATVDGWIAGHLLADAGDAPARVAAAAAAADLPPIAVSPLQGRMLALLVRLTGGRKVLEVGTLGGYSAAWMAAALAPGGRLLSLEVNERHAEVARRSLEAEGLPVEVRLGDGVAGLDALIADGDDGWDLAFLDAEKSINPPLLERSARLVRPGGLVVVDNVVRQGKVADADSDDPAVIGSRRTIEQAGADARLEATVLQTLGEKGWDGFLVAVVREA